MSTFLKRAVVALTLGPLALFLIYLGGYFYAVPLALVLAIATYEYTQITRQIGWRTSFVVLVPISIGLYAAAWWSDLNLTGPILLLGLLIALGYSLWKYEVSADKSAPAIWMATVGGMMLLGWLGSHFFLLRGVDSMAWQWTMLAMAGTWIADAGAYVVGKYLAGNVLGKHPLSPRLSPNKTIEGYFGGVLLGTALTVLLAYALQLPLPVAFLIALLITILSPLGDLGISLLKREADVKDSGRIFGGHGGALDRVDSLLWSVAITYYFVVFFQGTGLTQI